ncbi:MAG: hypothetical protein ABI742_01770 [Gemmatimonadota bacterium]
MRQPTSLFCLLLLTALPDAASAQRNVVNREATPRTWSQEMRDKAEASLYQKHDCTNALVQSTAAFDREMRHPERMDPRIPLVKARAHECLGQVPEAILNYAMHDRLAGFSTENDIALAGACSALLPAGKPADSTGLAHLTDSLTVVRSEIERARDRNSMELFIRTGSSSIGASARAGPRFSPNLPFDLGRATSTTNNEYYRVMRSSWYGAPAYSPATGYYRQATARATDAESQLAMALADVEARLLCLDSRR